MLDRVVARLVGILRRLRRVERREFAAFSRWIENTNNLLHLTVVVAVPLLIAFVTFVANTLEELSFLLFPPLASGTYTLFSDPEGQYASPVKFVVGLTVGAVCGWIALAVTTMVYGPPSMIHPESAALSIFLAGVATWALDVEEPSAFSSALLVLVIGPGRGATLFGASVSGATVYVLSVALSTALVAAVFTVWRETFYERRAQYLYDTARGDDHVLVPMRGETAEVTAVFAARLAAAHEAGKVVLLDVAPESNADADAGEAATRLEATARTIRTQVGVPCEVVVARGDPVPTTIETVRNANCDLVITPYEEDRGLLSQYVRGVFESPVDAVAFRSTTGRRRWKRVLVTVARPGDTAHAMLDFAARLVGRSGTVSVCTCIDREVERRPAEKRLADLAETVDVDVETRVARSEVTEFIDANAGGYDLLVVGSSRERSRASRFVSPPTFERLHDVACDVAVVDRGRP
ncbi:HPP family protein [Haloplanus sp. GCM10025708]|uniref:universal stress protein n=1 Tax=Haloferacaceae TaxID=1644056 RepID=UPI0036166729